MSVEDRYGLLIETVDQETISPESSADIVVIPKEKPQKAPEGWYCVPEKLQWHLKLPNTHEDYLSSLKRNRRKRILKAMRELDDLEIQIETPVRESHFSEWYPLYAQGLDTRNKAKPLIDASWLSKKDPEKVVAFFAKKDNEIVGGILCIKLKKGDTLSISYSAATPEMKEKGIMDLLNNAVIAYAIKQGFDYVTRGKDTNLYGHHLHTGLFTFKNSLGFSVRAHPKHAWNMMRIQNEDKLADPYFFVAQDTETYGVLVSLNPDIDTTPYENPGLTRIKVITRGAQ